MKKERFVTQLITTTAAFDGEITYTSAYDYAIADELMGLPISSRKLYLENFHIINGEYEQLFESLSKRLRRNAIEIRVDEIDETLRNAEKNWEKLSFLFGLTDDEEEGVSKVIDGMRRHAHERNKSALGLIEACRDFTEWLFESSHKFEIESRYDSILQTAEISVIEEITFLIASRVNNPMIEADLRRLLFCRLRDRGY